MFLSTNTNKKDLLVDAAKVLFNDSNTKITVRLPKPGDENVQPQEVQPVEKKKVAKADKYFYEVEASEEESNEEQAVEENPPKQKVNNEQTTKRLESDQEKMILDLFDGKFVD